jgi:hypothetical protein
MALFRSVFVISTLYAFMLSGFAFIITAAPENIKKFHISTCNGEFLKAAWVKDP